MSNVPDSLDELTAKAIAHERAVLGTPAQYLQEAKPANALGPSRDQLYLCGPTWSLRSISNARFLQPDCDPEIVFENAEGDNRSLPVVVQLPPGETERLGAALVAYAETARRQRRSG